MMRKRSLGKIWAAVFALWGVFLSGALASFIGSPGIIQALRLRSLLESKQTQVDRMQSEFLKLQMEATHLEKSKTAQQREIRRVLGYAAPDEIIFDFSGGDSI